MPTQAKPLPLLLALPLTLALTSQVGACVEPAEDLALDGDGGFRQANDLCSELGVLYCMANDDCGVQDFAHACDPCGMEAAAACFAEDDCSIDEYMELCNYDNDHTEQIKPGQLVTAEFDDANGVTYEIPIVVGANFGNGGLETSEGDFSCMGKCGDGCAPLVFETHDLIPKIWWLPDELEAVVRAWVSNMLSNQGISNIQLGDVWSRDCLEHDLCSYMLWEGNTVQEDDLNCGDEWVDTYDDFLPPIPQIGWTSGGPFCASDYGEGSMLDREHVVGRPGEVICGPNGKAWHCNANDLADAWTMTNDDCVIEVEPEIEDQTLWDDGVCRTYTITNPNDYPIEWVTEVVTPEGLYLEFWNSTIVDHGTSIEFRGQDEDPLLGPNQSTSFGYCREGLTGGQCEPSPAGCAGLTINELPPTSQWDTGLCRNVEVINVTQDWVEWEVKLELAGEVTESWNTYVSCEGTTCTFSGKDWNDVLAPDDPDDGFPGGGSASFGYCIEGFDQGGDGDGDVGGDGDGDGDIGGDGDGDGDGGDGDGDIGGDPIVETVVVHGYKAGTCQNQACLNWWEDSGVDIEADQTVSLSCPPDAGEISWTAGAPRTCAGQAGTWDESIAPQCPVFSLVAKIGANGVPQCIGMSGEFVAEASGRLYLGFNDGDVFSDNLGSWSVDLSVE